TLAGSLHLRFPRSGAARDREPLWRLLRRHPPERHGDGPGVRPSEGRHARDEGALQERHLGDLLDPRSARAAVQAGRAEDARAVRGDLGSGRGLDRRGARGSEGAGFAPGGVSDGTMATAEAHNYWKDADRPQSVEARARMMLERAHWAATAFATFDRERALRVAKAAADAGFAKAAHYAEWAVRETGFGVAEHKKIKNELCSRGLFEHYRDQDYIGKRIDPDRKIVEFARPAGVIFALVPSTNPVS